ncbi:MAG: hypothetical protein R3D78_05935 [Paracoccaceae bacterium]
MVQSLQDKKVLTVRTAGFAAVPRARPPSRSRPSTALPPEALNCQLVENIFRQRPP